MQSHRPLKIFAAVAVVALAVLPIPAQAQDRHRVCHFTGSGYVLLEVSDAGLVSHLAHAEDIYPAPADGCPEYGLPAATVTATPTAPATASPTPSPAPAGTVEAPDEVDEIPPPAETATPDTEVESDDATGSLPSVSSASPRRALPATGGDPRLILLAGLGLLLTGLGGRLRLGARR